MAAFFQNLAAFQGLIGAVLAFVAATWGMDFHSKRVEARSIERRCLYIRKVLLLETNNFVTFLAGERKQWDNVTDEQAEEIRKTITTEMSPRNLFSEVRGDLQFLELNEVEPIVEFYFHLDEIDHSTRLFS